jgi:hypothetical protein
MDSSRTFRKRLALTPLLVASVLLVACGEQYCQKGANSALQCYEINELEWHETVSRPEPPPERVTEPAPGCLVGGKVVPYTPAAGPRLRAPGAPGLVPNKFGLMSGACVSRRVPVHGAAP